MEEGGGGWRRVEEGGGGWRRVEEGGGGWRRVEEGDVRSEDWGENWGKGRLKTVQCASVS